MHIFSRHRVGVPESHHAGRQGGKGTIGAKSVTVKDHVSFRQAQFAVLQQAKDVMPYIDEHREMLQTIYPSRSQTWLDKKHKEEFVDWLRRRLLGIELGNQLDVLGKGPLSTFLKYQGYEINGFTIYTKKQDGKSTYQNSGVRFDAHDENGNVQATYFGFIEEIWELAYGPLKAALFRC